jgi:hypothetical protein
MPGAGLPPFSLRGGQVRIGRKRSPRRPARNSSILGAISVLSTCPVDSACPSPFHDAARGRGPTVARYPKGDIHAEPVLSQLLMTGGFGGVGFTVDAKSAGFLSLPDDFQIIAVAQTAPKTINKGTKRRITTAASPLMFILKNPQVKIQATESQIAHVEIVLLNSLFIIFFGFEEHRKLPQF